jgi:pimeloyl-ACP methyl ester carboxylesterase
MTGGAAVAALFSAMHPERVDSLVLYGAVAHVTPMSVGGEPTSDDDPPADYLRAVEKTWGTGITAHLYARSLLDEPGFVDWCAHYERSIASPGNAGAMVWMSYRWDLSPVLPTISVPTLVLWRQGDDSAAARPADYRNVAEQIPGARGVELPGRDHWPWADDADAVLHEIRRFLVDRTSGDRSTRQLAAVLFTDIVDSTAQAVEVGDQR